VWITDGVSEQRASVPRPYEGRDVGAGHGLDMAGPTLTKSPGQLTSSRHDRYGNIGLVVCWPEEAVCRLALRNRRDHSEAFVIPRSGQAGGQ
jgi:hypothetical protein